MSINISNRNGKVSEAIEERVRSWLDSCQERYFVITSVQVVLDRNERQEEDLAEATLHVKGHDLFAKASGKNLYAALDELEDKLERQLEKLKTRLVEKKGNKKPELAEEEEAVTV